MKQILPGPIRARPVPLPGDICVKYLAVVTYASLQDRNAYPILILRHGVLQGSLQGVSIPGGHRHVNKSGGEDPAAPYTTPEGSPYLQVGAPSEVPDVAGAVGVTAPT
jgi:hypothetical protein